MLLEVQAFYINHIVLLIAYIFHSFVVINLICISIKLTNQNKKFQSDSNILSSPKADQGNCLPNV